MKSKFPSKSLNYSIHQLKTQIIHFLLHVPVILPSDEIFVADEDFDCSVFFMVKLTNNVMFDTLCLIGVTICKGIAIDPFA